MKSCKSLIIAIALIGVCQVSFAKEEFSVSPAADGNDAVEAAQDSTAKKDRRDGKFFVGLQGGFNLMTSENGAAYFKSGNGGMLVRPVGGLFVGYFFHPRFGVRAAAVLADNASCANYNENYDPQGNRRFLPYRFQSASVFADFIINGGDVDRPKSFQWRFFGGVGLAHSYDFRSACATPIDDFMVYSHPYPITRSNDCFAFRFGFILEYVFKCGVGIMFEGNHEWMTDNFNGVSVKDSFPFDTRFNNQLGVTFHF